MTILIFLIVLGFFLKNVDIDWIVEGSYGVAKAVSDVDESDSFVERAQFLTQSKDLFIVRFLIVSAFVLFTAGVISAMAQPFAAGVKDVVTCLSKNAEPAKQAAPCATDSPSSEPTDPSTPPPTEEPTHSPTGSTLGTDGLSTAAPIGPTNPRSFDLPEGPLFKSNSVIIVEPGPVSLLNALRECHAKQIRLTGHTDNQAPRGRRADNWQYNIDLSLGRANALANWLTQQGRLPDLKVLTSGAGYSNPVAPNVGDKSLIQNYSA